MTPGQPSRAARRALFVLTWLVVACATEDEEEPTTLDPKVIAEDTCAEMCALPCSVDEAQCVDECLGIFEDRMCVKLWADNLKCATNVTGQCRLSYELIPECVEERSSWADCETSCASSCQRVRAVCGDDSAEYEACKNGCVPSSNPQSILYLCLTEATGRLDCATATQCVDGLSNPR